MGAPDGASALPVAPIAPEPFEPEVLTPVKLMIVMEAATDWDKVAVTVTLLRGLDANARQISASPLCPFVPTTWTQVRLPPDMFITFVFAPEV